MSRHDLVERTEDHEGKGIADEELADGSENHEKAALIGLVSSSYV